MLRKMLPPHNLPLAALAAEDGISEATLHNWHCAARDQGRLLPEGAIGPEGWSAADKFAAVFETAALNAAELGECCRRRGLCPEQNSLFAKKDGSGVLFSHLRHSERR